MRYLLWILIPGALLLASCNPKAFDGLKPTQPQYSGSYPNPLPIFNGTVAPGLSLGVLYLNPPSPPVTGESVTFNFGDTAVTPVKGSANLIYGVLSYGTGWQYIQFPLPVANNPIDLSQGNFSEVTFWAKGNQAMTPQCYATGTGGDIFNVNLSVTPDWQPMTIVFAPLGISHLNAVNNIFTIGITSATLPALIYLDDIEYR